MNTIRSVGLVQSPRDSFSTGPQTPATPPLRDGIPIGSSTGGVAPIFVGKSLIRLALITKVEPVTRASASKEVTRDPEE